MPSTSLSSASAAMLLALLAAPLPTDETATLRSDDATGEDQFGASVAISGKRIIVGAPGDTDSVGAALVFKSIAGGQFAREDTLTPDDAPLGTGFGSSADIDASHAIIGAPGDADEGADAGAAYLFRRSGSDWSQVVKLTHPMPAAGDRFGASVAIDARLAVVGAPDDNGLQPLAGSAHIFIRRGDTWEYAASISTGAANSSFGASVAVDGQRVIIGAPGDGGTGAAYIYRKRRNNQWTLEDQLLPDDRDADDAFGLSVAISGRFAIVGAPGDDEGGDGAGAAYLFERIAGQWALVDKVRDATATVGALGTSVAISGRLALAGTPAFPADGPDSGAAHLFRRADDATWPQATNALRPAKPGEDFRVGAGVALEAGIAAIAAPGDRAVFVFR